MSQALYRKYRSKTLDEVVGQDHITLLLKEALKQSRTSHAYLLTGPRGVGKTSIARILAYEINGIPYSDDGHLDIIEIDAASNNGVDDVRDLREKAALAPVAAKKKIYIIDEVHMLSKPAFNALLKTLEEPPAHVVFILATTDIEKLPQTIISRTQQLTFRTVEKDKVVKHLRYIADSEKIKIEDEALLLIAERGEGSFRDSIGLLDQFSSLSGTKKITSEIIELSLGIASHQVLSEIIAATKKHDLGTIISLTDTVYQQGVNAKILAEQLAQTIKGRIVSDATLLPLLEAVIEVSRSPRPELKLLSILGQYAKDSSKAATPQETTPKSVALAVSSDPKIDLPLPPAKKSVNPTKKLSTPSREKPSSQQFNWDALLAHVRKEHVALHSVLVKCTPSVDGESVTLYSVNAFYKKKLDDPRYSALLYKSLAEVGMSTVIIETVPTPPPPKDSQAAAIVAMMGGGEEIEIQEES